MGRRRHNQGNLGNYFQNLKDYFLGTTKANKASDDITKEYQKQIDERTKKRNEERTKELSDFDTARSKEVSDRQATYKADYDAAESTRKTALQNAEDKYKQAEFNRNHAANTAVIDRRKQLLQDDFDKNGGIYYDLNDGGFKFRDSFGNEQPVPARKIPSNTPIVIARHNNNNQLEVLDPVADNKIINNTLASKPFSPHMGTPEQNAADDANAQKLFSSYLGRTDADADLKASGINPEDIRSKAIQRDQSTKDYTKAKNKAEDAFNNNQSVQNYLGADDYVRGNGKYNDTERTSIINDSNDSGKDYRYDIDDIKAERDGKIGMARFKARATSPAAITAGAVVGVPTAVHYLNKAYDGTVDSLAELQSVPDGSAPGGITEEQKAQIDAAKNLKQAVADQKAQEDYYNQLESSGAIKSDEPIEIQNMRNGVEPERAQALQKVQEASALLQDYADEPPEISRTRSIDRLPSEVSPELAAIMQILQNGNEDESTARALADYTYNNYQNNPNLNRLGWRALLKQLYGSYFGNNGINLDNYRIVR